MSIRDIRKCAIRLPQESIPLASTDARLSVHNAVANVKRWTVLKHSFFDLLVAVILAEAKSETSFYYASFGNSRDDATRSVFRDLSEITEAGGYCSAWQTGYTRMHATFLLLSAAVANDVSYVCFGEFPRPPCMHTF
jgi:hypothetical protein